MYILWQPLVIKTNSNTSNKSLGRISSKDYKRTWQEVSARLLLSQIRYSLVVILELNSGSEVQYKDIMMVDDRKYQQE